LKNDRKNKAVNVFEPSVKDHITVSGNKPVYITVPEPEDKTAQEVAKRALEL